MHQRRDLLRAVMEGVTYSLNDCLGVLAGMGVKDVTSAARYGSGHINETYKVETASGTRRFG